MECGNGLGSRAGKVKFGALYAQLACLPRHISSELSTIFLCQLLLSKDKKRCKNSELFRNIIEEANFLLTEGLDIYDGTTRKRVKFQVILMTGDNLGLNDIFGYTKSFKTNYYCRRCKATSKAAACMSQENPFISRNVSNYDEDAKKANSEVSGIRELCAFHKMQNFHIAKNWSMDVMHDFMEGVATYVIHAVLKTLIYEKKLFSLQTLNNRLLNFNYGPGNPNKPPEIKEKTFKNRSTLKMSAAEVLCLTRYLCLIIGDLVEENDEHYELLKYLRRILDVLSCRWVKKSNTSYFKYLIKQHHELYMSLYGDLKPKFHFLIHYPEQLLQLGPCFDYSTMRFESRHRPVKSIVQSTSSKRNLLYTVAIKQSLAAFKNIQTYNIGEKIKIKSNDIIEVEILKNNKNIKMLKEVDVNGITYKVGMFLVTHIFKSLKLFGKIKSIVNVGDNLYFTTEQYKEVYFDEHFHSYAIERSSSEDLSLSFDTLAYIDPVLSITKNTATPSSKKQIIEHLICIKSGL